MVYGQRLAIHGIGQQGFGRASLLKTQTALERNGSRVAVDLATIATPENDVASASCYASAIEEFREGYAGPLCRAHCAQVPLLSRRGRFHFGAAIARAFK